MLFAAPDLVGTLQQAVELCADSIEGCDFAGIFMPAPGPLASPVHTDPVVTVVDALQQELGEGPCIDAMASRSAIYAEELRDDRRWPRFAPVAVARGVRSAFALHLSSGTDALGALNLYGRYPRAFGVIDRGRGIIVGNLVNLALSSAKRHADDQLRLDHLSAALATRELIGQAQGILMERERLSADQAFDVLRRASQHLNRKLREVAQDLVETGERPETNGPPATSRAAGSPALRSSARGG